jgi:hypothetical protein
MGTNHRQERLVLLLGPCLGDQQHHITALDVDRPMEDPLGTVARDRHAHLLADMAVAGIQRRCLRDDRLIEHQQHGTDAVLQAGLEPPFD